MEGVPRISMQSFPLRRSADTPSFKLKLKPFIRSMYGEDPDSYSGEVNALESLRAGAVHVTKDLGGVATLKKYYAQLHFLKSRFPLHDGQPCALSFSWYDAFSDSVHGWTDVDYEMACVLYNIGALHTELGATDNRLSAEGMKSACTHFQCAAWAFSHLRSHYTQFLSPDVGPETLSLMNSVSLAQAQECILEKSLIDSRKSSITAKVALQIVDYYESALRSTDAILKDSSSHSSALVKALKKWKKTLDVKVAYYLCLSLLYRGMQAEDDSKWGSRVAYYKASLDKLNDALKAAKALEKGDPINETLNFTLDVVGGKVGIAEKENEFVYHDKVPEAGVVEKEDGLKGVSLVKGIPFKVDDPGVSGGDIFGRLVPIEAHEHASLYSEEKAKLLRQYSARIQEKNEALEQFCTALQLDTLDLEGGPKIIPQELVDCCAGLSVNKDAVKRLSELMSTLSSLYHDVDGNMDEVNELLNQEEERGTGGGKQSNVLKELSREASKYGGAHKVAGETNEALGESLRRHVGNLQILMKPLDEVVRDHIPGGHTSVGGEEGEIVERMKKLVGKVKEMKEQRVNLEKQLRESLHGDDITKRLVVVAGGEEELEGVFTEEMRKHEGLTTLLDKNLSAQENIIRALTEANAAYADERRSREESSRQRVEVIEDLIASYEVYDDLLGKLNRGVEFYTKLDTNVGKLLNRLKATLKVGEDEREAATLKKGAFMHTPVPPVIQGQTAVGGMGLPDSGVSSFPQNTVPVAPIGGTGLKLKDYLAMKKAGGVSGGSADGPGVRPAPVGSEDMTKMDSVGMGAGFANNPSYYMPSSVPGCAALQQQYGGGSYGSGYGGVNQNSGQQPPTAPTSGPSMSEGTPQAAAPVNPQQQPATWNPSTPASSQTYIPGGGGGGQSSAYSNSPGMPGAAGGHYNPQPQHTAAVQPAYQSNPYANPIHQGQGQYQQQQQQHGQQDQQLQYQQPQNQQPQQHQVQPVSQQYAQQQQQFQQVPTQYPSFQAQPQYPNRPTEQPMQQNQYGPQPGFYPQSVYNGTRTNAAYSVPAYSSMPFQTTTTTFPSTYINAPTSGPPQSNPTSASSAPTYGSAGNGSVGPSVPRGVSSPASYATASSYSSSGTGTTPSSTSEYGNHSFLAQYVKQQGYTSNSQPHQANQQWPITSAYGQPMEIQQQHEMPSQQQWTSQHLQQPPQQQQEQFSQQHQHVQQQQGQFSQQNQPAQQQQGQFSQQNQPAQQQQGQFSQQNQPAQPQQTINSFAPLPSQSSQQNIRSPAAPDQQVVQKPQTNFDLLSSLDITDMPVQPLAPTPVHPPQQQESAEMVVIKAPPTPTAEITTPVVSAAPLASVISAPVGLSTVASIPDFGDDVKIHKAQPSKSKQKKHVDIEQLLIDTRKLEGVVASYVSEERWASLMSLQNGLCGGKRVSVGRMYSMKNRAPDILPFDEDRVPLPLTSDDYINASFLRPLSLPLIATQAPILLPSCSTAPDFFSMLWTQGVETWVTLVPNHDIGEHIYWPQEKGSTLTFGTLGVTLLAVNSRGAVTERTFSLKNGKTSRVAIQLQLTSWGGHGLPSDSKGLIDFVKEVREYFELQRSKTHPLVVHCIHGVGKTGLFSILLSGVNDVLEGRPLPDLVQLGGAASACRKGLLVDKEHLKYAHSAILHFCRSELIKHGVDPPPPVLPEKEEKTKNVLSRGSSTTSCSDHSAVDPFSLLDPLWSLKK